MTLNELKNSVLDLGFETSFDNEEMLLPALRRALHLIHIERPRLKTVHFGVKPAIGRLIEESIFHKGGEDIKIPVSGIAVSFKVSGEGYLKIDYANISETREFYGNMSEIKIILRGESAITFCGEFNYSVYSLAEYDTLYSEGECNIPIWGEAPSFNIEKIFGDFLAPNDAPEVDGKKVLGARLEEGVLYLPKNFSGEISLTYRRAPRYISGEDGEEEIDISRECEELLPLLVASYLWLDDDSDKANYYMALYKDAMATIKVTNPRSVGAIYTTNGWA